MNNAELLQVRDLRVWFGSKASPIRAVDGVSFDIQAGQTVAIVGESGCGKSVTALSLARLIQSPPARYESGQVLFEGKDILSLTGRDLARVRGRDISYVFQEPGTALNPVFRIGYQIEEAIQIHRPGSDSHKEAVEMLEMVGLPDPASRMKSYPHELSGGMQQRVMIAMALVCRPRLLVADEPTTALDVTIQAQILELLTSLQARLKMSILLITHNLGLVADRAHWVHVMYAGRIVESGDAVSVLRNPAHPYTRGLLNAVPKLTQTSAQVTGIPGQVPNPARLPVGCKFADRCNRVESTCLAKEPELDTSRSTHLVRCFFPLTDGRADKSVVTAGRVA
jgi:oligopeptide/dipeptide ABC transporter ATP-binding protein